MRFRYQYYCYFDMYNIKEIINDVVKDGIRISALLLIAGIAYIGIQKLGILSYTGLSVAQVKKVATEMDKRCKILSRVTGKDLFGNTFYRGIYLGGATTFPLYYHYNIAADGKSADYSIYPLLWQETWLSSPDILGLTGHSVYPV